MKSDNFVNILIQTSSTGILAVGMTFVLLTAGVDLSVGSIMFVAAAIGGKLVLGGWSFGSSLAVMLGIGLIYGALNAVFITRLAIVAFIVTLATRYFGRGLGLRITETRAMNLPDSFYELGAARVLGVPAPVLIFAGVVVLAHLCLTRTPFGRQVYAVGADLEAARKAGINTGMVLFVVYVICGLCAAVAAVVALSQAPAVSPTFRQQPRVPGHRGGGARRHQPVRRTRRRVSGDSARSRADPDPGERPEHPERESLPVPAHHQSRNLCGRPAGRLPQPHPCPSQPPPHFRREIRLIIPSTRCLAR